MNVNMAEFEYDDTDPEGYKAGLARLGPQLGAVETGTSVYELPPGQSICPYHYEWAEEEWLIVLEGAPTLRHPGGRGGARARATSASSRSAPPGRTR